MGLLGKRLRANPPPGPDAVPLLNEAWQVRAGRYDYPRRQSFFQNASDSLFVRLSPLVLSPMRVP